MRILLATTFIFLFIWSHAQINNTGIIQGTVISELTGESLPGIIIGIKDSGKYVMSDEEGRFRFNELFPGKYAVFTKTSYFENDTLEDIIVSAGNLSSCIIRLKELNCCEVPPIFEPVFKKKTAFVIGGIQTTLIAGSLIGLNQLWYKPYPRESFHTFDDNGEWLQMDKIGHIQSAYSIGLISTRLWNLSQMDRRKAAWIGGLTGFSYLTAVEIMDGYSSGWGFSSGDMIANMAGTALFLSQELTWGTQRIQPKFGFRRSGYASYRPELLGTTYVEQMLKDYNGQTYWLSVNVASFLKEDSRFPQWLNVAFGYGANGMTGGHENPVMYNSQGNAITFNRYRQYYLSLDVDLRKLPVRSRFLRALFTCISFIKIPAPGIELSGNGVRPLLFAF